MVNIQLTRNIQPYHSPVLCLYLSDCLGSTRFILSISLSRPGLVLSDFGLGSSRSGLVSSSWFFLVFGIWFYFLPCKKLNVVIEINTTELCRVFFVYFFIQLFYWFFVLIHIYKSSLKKREKNIGVRGFEPLTPASQTQYSARLSYTPLWLNRNIIYRISSGVNCIVHSFTSQWYYRDNSTPHSEGYCNYFG